MADGEEEGQRKADIPEVDDSAHSHTKVVATIGPGSEDLIADLVDAGMSVARLNFSHGTPEEHRRRVSKIREIAGAKMTSIGILADIPGPKVRLGCFEQGKAYLRRGDRVTVRAGSGIAAQGEVLIDFDGFLQAVRPGQRIFLGDGQVELIVESTAEDSLGARVRRGGALADRRGVHMPDSEIRYALPTDEDRELLVLARELGIDMVGVSFVSRASELREVRR
ncbi:MAG: pyruvate kinase, partial [Planctomycetota bacterium]